MMMLFWLYVCLLFSLDIRSFNHRYNHMHKSLFGVFHVGSRCAYVFFRASGKVCLGLSTPGGPLGRQKNIRVLFLS